MRSRFNVHFERMDSIAMTPSVVVDALRRYVDFGEEADGASLRVRRGVVLVGERTTYLKEGLTIQEVVRLLGEPVAVSTRDELTIYEFARTEGQIVVAEFVAGELVNSRTENRSATARSFEKRVN